MSNIWKVAVKRYWPIFFLGLLVSIFLVIVYIQQNQNGKPLAPTAPQSKPSAFEIQGNGCVLSYDVVSADATNAQFSTTSTVTAAGITSANSSCVTLNQQASPFCDQNGSGANVILSYSNNCGDISTRSPLDVMIVLDASGSMTGQPLADAKSAALQLISDLNPSIDRVGLVRFSDTGAIQAHLTNDFTSVSDSVNSLAANGWTNIGDGLLKGQQELVYWLVYWSAYSSAYWLALG